MTDKIDQSVDKSPERIRKMFGEIAQRYDFLNHFLSLGIDRSWRRRVVREVYDHLLKQGDPITAPILDVATGTGDLALEFLFRQRKKHILFDHFVLPKNLQTTDLQITDLQGCQKSLADYKIIGVDFVPEMLVSAQIKLQKKQAENEILLSVGDGLNLPFPADIFSAVTIAFGLRNMYDTDRGIAEMVRVCRPGGIIAILEFTMPQFPLYASVYRFYFKYILPRLGQWIAKNKESAYHYLPESVQSFDDIAKMKERLQAAELVNIRVIPMTFGTTTLYLAEKAPV